MLRNPSTFKLLFINVFPVSAPRYNSVADAKAFTVVAYVLNRLTTLDVVEMSPPVKTRCALLMVTLALLEPIFNEVAAPKALIEVAIVLKTDADVEVVFMSPPLTERSFPIVVVPELEPILTSDDVLNI